jgi:hypothetical protein
MKWFKHETTARHSEKLSALEQKTGLEGYGFYFKTLEIVAGLMDESDRHEAEFSPTSWARQANISTKKWLYLVQCCADVGLMSVQRGADVVSVKIPKLLKRRDNYTKNLQVRSDENNKNVSLEVEEIRSRKDIVTPAGAAPTATPSPSPKKGTRLPDDWQPSDDLLSWAKQKRPDLNLTDTALSFCNYWQAKAGKDACKLDWGKTFKNWVLSQKAVQFVKPEVRPAPTRPAPETSEQLAQRKAYEADAWKRQLIEFGVNEL